MGANLDAKRLGCRLWTVDKMTMPGSFFYPFIF